MFDLFCFIFMPIIAFIAIGRDYRGERNRVLFAVGYVMLALAIMQITAITMIPIERAAVRIGWNGMGGAFIYVSYGAVAVAAACVISLALGFLIRGQIRKYDISAHVGVNVLVPRLSAGRVLVHVCVLGLLVLTMSYTWALSQFGNVGFAEIVFHMNVPLKGTAHDIIMTYVKRGLIPAFGWFLLFEALVFFPSGRAYQFVSERKACVLIQVFPLYVKGNIAAAGLLMWFIFLLIGFSDSFDAVRYFAGRAMESTLIEERYVDPKDVQITFPEQKRNLITIYVESAETSSMDKANGGMFKVNYTPEMTCIAKDNVSFSHSDKLEGAVVAPSCGWTIAGLVAETAGLPLKLYEEERLEAHNSMDLFSVFMPGATTLGDILKSEGYRTVFMCGSDLSFGGRRTFYTQHGDYEICDLLEAKTRGRISQEYHVNWGFEDEKLYEWAKEELTLLAEGGAPFHFSMLTADTHSPEGYLCRLCTNTYKEQLANVLVCSSSQLMNFLNWCSEQSFYDNTTIVVLGDHASMAPDFYQEGMIEIHSGNTERKVYNAFINAVMDPVQEENRLFTTLDFFPTTLAAMGVIIEGDRLGIGTNLFSAEKTLAEEYGYEYLFEELEKMSTFYNETIMFP